MTDGFLSEPYTGILFGWILGIITVTVSTWLAYFYRLKAERSAMDQERIYGPLWTVLRSASFQRGRALEGWSIQWDREAYDKIRASALLNEPRHDRLRQDVGKLDESWLAVDQRYTNYYETERVMIHKVMEKTEAKDQAGELVSLGAYYNVLSYSSGIHEQMAGKFVVTAFEWIARETKVPFDFDSLRKALYDVHEEFGKAVKLQWDDYTKVVNQHFNGIGEILERLKYVTRYPRKAYGERLPLGGS